MSGNSGQFGEPDAVLIKAAQHWTRQADEGAAADATDLQDWLADNAAHQEAFEEIEAAWVDAEALNAVREDLLMASAPVAILRPKTRMKSQTLSRVMMAMAACLALVVGGAFVTPLLLASDLSTEAGEVRSFTLSDGSRITLDGHSAVDIAFTKEARRIVLRSGAVYVVAAPKNAQEPRALVVKAGNGQAQALGTQFAVERTGSQVRVSVTEHSVAVTSGKSEEIVRTGHSVRYGSEGIEAVMPVMVGQTAGWREGRVLFDRVPLAEVVAQLNRHRETPIVILGGDLSRRQVSGIFDLNDPASALDTIGLSLNLRQTHTPWAHFVSAEARK
ncbi:MAG: FecR domain-containing protein [Asticcacaulis sp.]